METKRTKSLALATAALVASRRPAVAVAKFLDLMRLEVALEKELMTH